MSIEHIATGYAEIYMHTIQLTRAFSVIRKHTYFIHTFIGMLAQYNISIKFITKIAEFVVRAEKFSAVVFSMIELMVHVISTEMPMPCKCMRVSQSQAQYTMPIAQLCHAKCNVFIFISLE